MTTIMTGRNRHLLGKRRILAVILEPKFRGDDFICNDPIRQQFFAPGAQGVAKRWIEKQIRSATDPNAGDWFGEIYEQEWQAHDIDAPEYRAVLHDAEPIDLVRHIGSPLRDGTFDWERVQA